MPKMKTAIMKYGAVPVSTGLMVLVSTIPAFASDSSSGVVSASDWSSVISAITAQVSPSTIVGVIAAGITACIGIVFMWWGVRKMGRALMAAFRKGKLSI